MERIDIGYGSTGAARTLSNLSKHVFEFRGFECHSAEAVLKSCKWNAPDWQREVLTKHGMSAYYLKVPSGRNQGPDKWTNKHVLWWQGRPMARFSTEWREFYTELYAAISRHSLTYREALLSTRGKQLCHTIGHDDPRKTIITEDEFVKALETVRDVYWIT